MSNPLSILLLDLHRAWTVSELAEEAELDRAETQAILDEAEQDGIARWVIFDDTTLWLAQEQQPHETLRDAWERLSARSGVPFVSLAELAHATGATPEDLHRSIARAEERHEVSFSGTNLAVLSPEARRYAYTTRAGDKVFLLRFRNRVAS